MTLTRDPDGTVGAVTATASDGTVTTITETDSKWIFELGGETREVLRILTDEAEDSLLIAEAFAAYQSAFTRFNNGDPFVILGNTGNFSDDLNSSEDGESDLELDGLDDSGVQEMPPDIEIELPGGDTFDEGFNQIEEESSVVQITGFEDAPEDSPISGSLNIFGTDASSLDFVVTQEPNNGTAIINDDGTFSFVPFANFNGQDSFTVSAVTDSGSRAWLSSTFFR